MTSVLFTIALSCLTFNETKSDTATNCYLKSCSYADITVSYIYDKKGRPVVISRVKADGIILATEKYIYKSDSVEHTIVQNNGELVILEAYRLNEMGFVESGTETWISKGNRLTVSDYTYQYNSEGYLVYKIGTREHKTVYEGNFFYNDGNLTTALLKQVEISYEYYSDKKRINSGDTQLFGKNKQNLFKTKRYFNETGGIESGIERTEYSYDFDITGNVIKEYRKDFLKDKSVALQETDYIYDCN